MIFDESSKPVSVLIHPNQFPQAIEAAMSESLRTRRMNHKFHYDTPKQALKWLRLHEALSPARTDPDCERIYREAFQHCVTGLAGVNGVEVVSLGCGGGQKDAQLLNQLRTALPGRRLRYVPVDVSAGLALTAREAAMKIGVGSDDIAPMVVDLALAADWASALAPALGKSECRIVCFFGMLPNFIPGDVLPQLAALLRPSDLLLVSANLAPGPDYAAGVAQVLPLYDNALTSDWLWSVLLDLGVEKNDGELKFSIATSPRDVGLMRIEANFTFMRKTRVQHARNIFEYSPGDVFGLFYSYRHTPERLRQMFAPLGMDVRSQWVNGSGEEGVFLCARRG